MWFLLAIVVVCFTIMVMFRMFIDLRRVNNQHERLMRSDARDYERYIEVASRPAPKAALPDFKPIAELPRTPLVIDPTDVRYWREDEPVTPRPLTGAQLEALKRTYEREDYERFMHQRRKEGLYPDYRDTARRTR